MKSEQEVKAALLEKAGADPAFRARLVADPVETVEQEFDIGIPEGFSLHVHEETATSAHLVLPSAGGLDVTAMGAVSGGLVRTGPLAGW